jgi:hypothetical protein
MVPSPAADKLRNAKPSTRNEGLKNLEWLRQQSRGSFVSGPGCDTLRGEADENLQQNRGGEPDGERWQALLYAAGGAGRRHLSLHATGASQNIHDVV